MCRFVVAQGTNYSGLNRGRSEPIGKPARGPQPNVDAFERAKFPRISLVARCSPIKPDLLGWHDVVAHSPLSVVNDVTS